MNSASARRLIALNRTFYSERGRDFSETRLRLQPGVLRLLDSLHGNESILDLGCGNGEMARALSRRGHQGSYLGLDFSLPLLTQGQRESFSFPVRFEQADLCEWSLVEDDLEARNRWSVITAFAVLHHLPGHDLRLAVMLKSWQLLRPEGFLMLSSWQFLSSPRLKARIQPWGAAGMSAQEVDPDDYLIDWRRGGKGLRYVHHLSTAELTHLASESQFEIVQTFLSDGEQGKLGLYQVWKKL